MLTSECIKIRVSALCTAQIGIVALRLVSYTLRPPIKVVAVDCDNTLWSGVVGEDGPEALTPNLALQTALQSCLQRGMLLVTCSKNVPADVEAAFASHPEWPLRYSDFILHKESWEAKCVSLRAAAAELGLSELSAFAFIDDSPLEVCAMRRATQNMRCDRIECTPPYLLGEPAPAGRSLQ